MTCPHCKGPSNHGFCGACERILVCNCGDMPPGGVWPKGEEPPYGCPIHHDLNKKLMERTFKK